ncbi:hypothetical protein BDC45DRAFT_561879 [Circinella umbellata]|nr:hypothetical protein BDC45DRAFT_561879 [Circinella umbellata]
MSTLNTVLEVKSGTNVLVNEYNWDVPHEYLYCFNVNDDEIMTEAIELKLSIEWIAYTGPQNSTTDIPAVEPPIKRLLGLYYYKIHRSIPKAIEIDENASVEKRVNTVQKEKKKSNNTKIRGPYKACTPYKLQCLIDLVFLWLFS